MKDYINANKEKFNVEVLYSNPDDYIKAINSQGIKYPTKNDDFFPYADRDLNYWGGYFTSRIALKYAVRERGRYLQSMRTYISLLYLNKQSTWLNNNFEKFMAGL